jgi:hypothetical protein
LRKGDNTAKKPVKQKGYTEKSRKQPAVLALAPQRSKPCSPGDNRLAVLAPQ